MSDRTSFDIRSTDRTHKVFVKNLFTLLTHYPYTLANLSISVHHPNYRNVILFTSAYQPYNNNQIINMARDKVFPTFLRRTELMVE